MRIVFLGSGALACPALERLYRRPDDTVAAVVTQPDRAAGRGQRPRACAVRRLADALGLPVRTPASINAPDEIAALRVLAPDLLVVTAYGQILKPAVLDLAPLGAVNIHPSLLPRYRGAAPIQWAIAKGERETGVTLMFLSPRMDAGDIILARRVAIGPDETAGELEARLAVVGADLLADVLDLFRTASVPRVPQDEALATYAPRLTKEDGRIDWALPAEMLRNRVRGFHPWPGCFTTVPDSPPFALKVHAARVEDAAGEAGRVLDVSGDGPLVAAGSGALRLLTVQPEGGRIMDGGAFARGRKCWPGQRLG